MQYNVFEHDALKLFKEMKKKINRGELPEGYIEQSLDYMYKQAVITEDNLAYGDSVILMSYKKGEMNHVFIEDDKLYELLKESELKEQFDIDALIDSGIMKRQSSSTYGEIGGLIPTYGAVIHARDTKCAVAVVLMDGRAYNSKLNMYLGRNNDIAILARAQLLNEQKSEDAYEAFKNDREAMEKIKIVHNLSMYVRAFKGVVREGVPEAQPQYYEKAKGRIVRVSEEIREHLKEVSPHMRRGYFKKLESEYFTKKKRGDSVCKGDICEREGKNRGNRSNAIKKRE